MTEKQTDETAIPIERDVVEYPTDEVTADTVPDDVMLTALDDDSSPGTAGASDMTVLADAEEDAAREAAALHASGRPDSTTVERGGVSLAQADTIHVRQGGIARAEAHEIEVTQGGVAYARADEVEVEMGAVGLGIARELELSRGAANVVIAREAEVGQALVQTMIAGSVHAERPTGVLFLVAGRASGDIRPVFDWRGALVIGLILAVVTRVLRRGGDSSSDGD